MNALARLFAVLVLAAVAACGGGMQAGVGSGGSGAPVSVGVGPVTGFGSIIANGERYDESAAEVLLDERPDRATPATVAAIRLGMHVELQHRNFMVTTARAGAELVGPVSSVTASSFDALGQTVRVNADPARPTVFDGFESMAELADGTTVEVHGDRASTGEILATRVELRPAGLALVRIAGTASSVNGRRFSIGALSVDASSASMVPAGATIAGGERVVAWTDVPYTGGALAVKVVRVGSPAIAANATVTVDGVIGDFRAPSGFRVGGVPVNAGNAAVSYAGGSAIDLRNGVQVRVRGTFTGGFVNATRVEFLQAAQATVQLIGPITDFVDTSTPFRIRNTLARVTTQTTYANGSPSNLGTGVMVKVAGPLTSGIVQATSVEFLPPGVDMQNVVSGPIAAPISALAADGSRTFRLDGLTGDVRISSATVYKDGAAADVAVGRQVKVKGSPQGLEFAADEVQFLDNPASPPTFEIDGIAGNVRSASVVVNGQTIALSAATAYTLDGASTTSASLRNGRAVAVVATRVNGTVTARSIDVRTPDNGATSIRGRVSGRTPRNAEQFMVGSQRVNVEDDPRVLPASKSLADVVNGADIEVDGTLSRGVLNATRIHIR